MIEILRGIATASRRSKREVYGYFELRQIEDRNLIRCGVTVNTRRAYADWREELYAGPTWRDAAEKIP